MKSPAAAMEAAAAGRFPGDARGVARCGGPARGRPCPRSAAEAAGAEHDCHRAAAEERTDPAGQSKRIPALIRLAGAVISGTSPRWLPVAARPKVRVLAACLVRRYAAGLRMRRRLTGTGVDGPGRAWDLWTWLGLYAGRLHSPYCMLAGESYPARKRGRWAGACTLPLFGPRRDWPTASGGGGGGAAVRACRWG